MAELATGGRKEEAFKQFKQNVRRQSRAVQEKLVALAESRLRETRAQLAKTELALNLEVQQAELDYDQAGQRLQVTEKMVAAAEETARLSRERFREGVILAIDLIDVETRLSDSLSRRSSARCQLQIARANLRRAMGLPQFDEAVATEKEIVR